MTFPLISLQLIDVRHVLKVEAERQGSTERGTSDWRCQGREISKIIFLISLGTVPLPKVQRQNSLREKWLKYLYD